MQASIMQISDAEWDVMQVIWAEQPRTAAEVISELSQTHDWNHRTVRTLLARLVEKQALDYEVDGARYIYRAAVTQDECIRQRSESFVSRVFGGNVSALVAHFVEDGSLSDSEVDELMDLLEDSKTKHKRRKRT